MAVDIRPSPIAGTWYPGNPQALAESVDRQLAQAEVHTPPGEIVAVVAPHAGHQYSGQVAALAFRCLQGLEPHTVAIVSPLHQPLPGAIVSTAHQAYGTPLGQIPVAQGLLDSLDEHLSQHYGLSLERVRHDREHSLEIELPFLQRVLSKPFQLVPLMLRDQTEATLRAAGRALAAVLKGESAILVASSDLSHFYPDRIARQLDAELLARLEAFDPLAVLRAEDEGVGFACGRGAIAAVLWASAELGADCVQILGHATSGDVTGDLSSVVGYGAAVVYRSKPGS